MSLNGNLILCANNLLTAATLSSNQAVLRALANLQDPIRLVKTRLNGVSNVQITADLGSAQDWQAVIIFDTNMTAAGTIEVRSSIDNFSSSNTLEGTITIGAQPFQLCHPFFLADSVSSRYARFVCDDASNPDGYIELGVGYLGPVQEFSNNFAFGAQIEAVDATQVVYSPAGAPHRTPGAKWRRVTWSLLSLSEAEGWQTFLDLIMDLGVSKDCFLCLWPTHSDTALLKRGTLYGAFTQVGGLVAKPTVAQIYSVNQLGFEES